MKAKCGEQLFYANKKIINTVDEVKITSYKPLRRENVKNLLKEVGHLVPINIRSRLTNGY